MIPEKELLLVRRRSGKSCALALAVLDDERGKLVDDAPGYHAKKIFAYRRGRHLKRNCGKNRTRSA